MKVELSNDTVDAIFQSILIEDYVMLKSDTARLKDSPNLEKYQKEDLKANKEYLKAMKTLMTYYIGPEWKRKVKDLQNKEL
jgi:predicted nucleotidyltransferase